MEPYHRQPPAKNTKSKLEKEKRSRPHPPLFQSYRTHLNRAQEKKQPVQAPPPTPGQHSNKSYRPDTPHSGALHGRKIRPGPPEKFPRSSPKINRTRDKSNKWTNTHETPPESTTKYKEKSHQKNIKRKPP
jgi:hypothetical protein